MSETALMQCRLKEISEICDVLNESDRVIKDLSERLQWDTKHLLREQTVKKAQCPFSSDHLIKSGDLDNHIPKCRSIQMGFTQVESSSRFYDNTSSVVSITADITTQGNDSDIAVPAAFHVYMHSPEERLNQYDNDIKITSSKRKTEREQFESDLSESTQDGKETISESQKSELQLLAEQRDYKRRRQSYRAKNVHITKRTPLEITREIIKNRMEELENACQETRKATMS